MNQENIAVVFSGGSTNGFAYLGVLKYFEENNISPALVGGTSAGSLFAALIAAGYTYQEGLDYSNSLAKRLPDMKDFAYKDMWKSLLKFDLDLFGGIIKGKKIRNEIYEALQKKNVEKFSDFKIPFYLHTINIENGKDILAASCDDNYVTHNAADWIRASISMPGIFYPARINGNYYVDGAVRSNYPILSAVEIGKNAGIEIEKVISISIEDQFLDSFDSDTKSFLDILQRTSKLALIDQYESDHTLFRKKYPEIDLIEIRVPKALKATDIDVDIDKLIQVGYNAIFLNELI